MCARRGPRSRPAGGEGKSDALDATRIARETLADPRVPRAFKQAGADRGPDSVHEQILLWHKARRSLAKTRVHLLNEADHHIIELPLANKARKGVTNAIEGRLEHVVAELAAAS